MFDDVPGLKKILQTVDGINLSLSGYDDKSNNEVLCDKTDFNRFDRIEDIIELSGDADKLE